jgi:hypothetical protein
MKDMGSKKLKSWNPEKLAILDAPQNFSFSGFLNIGQALLPMK